MFAFATLRKADGGPRALQLHSIGISLLGGGRDEGAEGKQGDVSGDVITNVPVDDEGVHMFALPSGQVPSLDAMRACVVWCRVFACLSEAQLAYGVPLGLRGRC